ncbi:hypothetical protein DBR00_01720 [Pseudomonas sp. HMWF032]|uniref:DUF6160 family protein n=1 Tax=unclassified Pseudomonas TaxID=196821 RepID=UPI000D396D9A|nr:MULTISPECIES: DUF6160 family protein [unclassified Pseudomonas]PTS86301.1 hypothetical protein DBR00_01720 [Pseudomonas sp. HMWF032]PTT82735.1 hypothetical protein DBR41_12850 [Pseudomonas sp. HMWF010]WAC44061.1 DUF6160 family protein [Pseudomonas sp. SL4(2022)]
MKTLKQLALAAAVLAVPFMAQAELKAMDDSSLSSVTGQAGISISGNFNGSIGKISYIDDGNSLNMETVAFSGFNISDSAPVLVDVVSTDINGTATQQLQISLPTITGEVSIGAIKMGTGASIGSLAINGMNMAGTTVKVWGH